MKSSIEMKQEQFVSNLNATKPVQVEDVEACSLDTEKVLVDAIQDLFLIVEKQRRIIEELKERVWRN